MQHELLGDNTSHSGRLLAFLGCHIAEPVFHPVERQYPEVALLAHIHGLRGEHVEGIGYRAGVDHYLRDVHPLLVGEAVPSHSQWLGPLQISRERAQHRAEAGYGLESAQLDCMVSSPFVGNGAGLENFMRRFHPGMLVALPFLRKALLGAPVTERVQQWLQKTSGLPLETLQVIYRLRQAA